MLYETFTSREIADVINTLGFRAKIVVEDDNTKIESASSAVKWSVWLGSEEPFFPEMHLSTVIWTQNEPFTWASTWNENNSWSMAHVMRPNGSDLVEPDEDDEYAIMITFSYDFAGGVSHRFIEQAISRWISTIDRLVLMDDVRTLAATSR
jgi:hypothetical protein